MASKQKAPIDYNTLPILGPQRILFPNAILPLTVGRDSSLKLISDLKEDEKYVGVISQRDPRVVLFKRLLAALDIGVARGNVQDQSLPVNRFKILSGIPQR